MLLVHLTANTVNHRADTYLSVLPLLQTWHLPTKSGFNSALTLSSLKLRLVLLHLFLHLSNTQGNVCQPLLCLHTITYDGLLQLMRRND